MKSKILLFDFLICFTALLCISVSDTVASDMCLRTESIVDSIYFYDDSCSCQDYNKSNEAILIKQKQSLIELNNQFDKELEETNELKQKLITYIARLENNQNK